MVESERFEIHTHGDVVEIRLTDKELSDLTVQGELNDQMLGFVEREKPSKLLVNFDNVLFCTSGTVGGLLAIRSAMNNFGGELRLCSLFGQVRNTFQLLNLDGTIFNIDENVEESVPKF